MRGHPWTGACFDGGVRFGFERRTYGVRTTFKIGDAEAGRGMPILHGVYSFTLPTTTTRPRWFPLDSSWAGDINGSQGTLAACVHYEGA